MGGPLGAVTSLVQDNAPAALQAAASTAEKAGRFKNKTKPKNIVQEQLLKIERLNR